MDKYPAFNWTNEVPYGWQPELTLTRSINSIEWYLEMVDWINKNIENAEQNVHWTISVWPVLRFRKAKDQTLFMLRWA
jgi:hypothetical protein